MTVAHHLLVALALGEAAQRARGAARLAVPRDAGLEPARDLVRVAGEHLRRPGAVVEADERLGDDEAALREPVAVRGERHGRLELGDVVVGEVADHRQPERLGLVERHEPRARAHPRAPTEPARARPTRAGSSRVPIPRRRRYAPSGVRRSVVIGGV